MKNLLIGSLVGGIIIWMWGFLSWTMLNIHDSQNERLANQDEIVTFLKEKIGKTGSYFVPQADPSLSGDEQMAWEKSMTGKPWAQIHYREAYGDNMGLNMLRGFLTSSIAVFILAWLLSQFVSLDMKKAILTAIGVGIIGYLTGKYAEAIWYEYNTLPDLFDIVIQWALVGAWLGWWLKR